MINLILFLILFGILVFIHEFGHFIVAKKTGVGVEKFFLGWGPKIFSFKRGETEYGVSWIPLGGYVKLVGEDPSEQQTGERNEKSFMSKSPLKRIAIVSAGPFSNLLLPIILFAFLFLIGIPSLAPVVGEVIEDSPAAKGGLLQGDKILKIGDRIISKWDDLTQIIRKSNGKEILFDVERHGEVLNLSVVPKLSKVENIYREKVTGWTVGITPYQYEPAIGLLGTGSRAYKIGLRNGDIIKKIGGEGIEYYWQFEQFLKNTKLKSFKLTMLRGKEKSKEELNFDVKWNPKLYNSPKDIGIYRSELFIASVKPESIAAEKGIKTGDMLTSIDGNKAYSWLDLEKKIQENEGEPVNLAVLRGDKKINFNITPKLTASQDRITGAHEKKRELGVEPLAIMKEPPAFEFEEKTHNPIEALYLGAIKTFEILKTQIVGFVKLIQGKLSVKNIGGPILIYKLAGRSYEMGGVFSFISYIALLSIVLGFVNLLPIPIMDGGHIFFFLVEIAKKKPLSIRAREVAQRFGFAIIIGLLVLATYNDIKRYFLSNIMEFFKRVF